MRFKIAGIILFFFCSWVMNQTLLSSADDAPDRAALMDLYKATGGSNWKNNSGWGDGAISNAWHGIEVNSQGRVTRIDLYNNNLRGQLPESIGKLTKVTYMNLKRNHLAGQIPSSIGDMASLEWLILAGRNYQIGPTLKEPPRDLTYPYHQGKHLSNTNDFSGRIPTTIGNLLNLRRLEIANQPNIKGPIPSSIGNLSNLEGLYLSFDDFSGTKIPSSIGDLWNLKHLYIASAQLEGEIPASLENLTQLMYLNLGESSHRTPDNHLTGQIPNFKAFVNLRSIALTGNKLRGEYPKYWNDGNFTKLNTLRLSWNQLRGTLHGFNNLPALESFGVEGNNLTGTIAEQLKELPERLQILGLGWNNFTGELPQNGWPDFYKLKTLYLNDNQLSGSIPCDFWEKIDNEKLGIAWLKNNEFSSNCSKAMNQLKGDGNLDIQVKGNNFY